MTTDEELEAITDTGQFEKLASAILRAADVRYAKLIELGTNAQGKPIRSPIDGVVVLGSGEAVVAAAYTTTDLEHLRVKWLDATDGDLIKAIADLKDAVRSTPTYKKAVVVLVTNRSPAGELLKEVGRRCADANVELDLWERSRLAGFLDHKPEGQWLRQDLLGVTARQMSQGLLMALSQKSRAEYAKTIPSSSKLVKRKDEAALADRTAAPGVTIVWAPSGYGKSALALHMMDAALRVGRPALWINDRILDEQASLERATHTALEELHGSPLTDSFPYLACPPGCLVIVDDVAKTRAPGRSLERIFSWTQSGQTHSSNQPGGAIHLLVPAWPEVMTTIRDDIRKQLAPQLFEMQPLDLDEAMEVYRLRTDDSGRTDEEVAHIVEHLGKDPLLIDLYDPSDPNQRPDEIVLSWITRQLRAVSENTGLPLGRYQNVLLCLAIGMLRSRTMTPSDKDVNKFFSDAAQMDDLAAIIKESGTLRWVHAPGEDRLSFRHDRVRDAILSNAIGTLIDSDPRDDVLADPYYADLLGASIVHRRFDEAALTVAETSSPLSLFAAWRKIGRPNIPSDPRLMARIKKLFAVDLGLGVLPTSCRGAMAWLLADTDAPEVEEISKLLAVRGFTIDEALIRNGDVNVAVNFVLSHDLGLTYPRRDRLIAHAAHRHPRFAEAIQNALGRSDLNSNTKRAFLLLAGFSKRQDLAPGVEKCLTNLPLRGPGEVESALWAVTQCCSEGAERLLDIVFAAFSELSAAPPDSAHPSERDHALMDLGGRRIAEELPQEKVPAIIAQWTKRAEIRNELDAFLSRVDDPRALTHVIRSLAQEQRDTVSAGKSPWSYSLRFDEWRTDLPRSRHRRMSSDTRDALRDIWRNVAEPNEDRTAAFGLWSTQVSLADLPILRDSASDLLLGDDISRTRVRLGDRTAFADFVRRVSQAPANAVQFWWHFARGFMDSELAAGVEACLQREDLNLNRDSGLSLSELIMEMEPSVAEKILEKHWARIKDNSRFFQAALFINTERTRSLAADILARAAEPAKLFEHLLHHFGFNEHGRSHRVTLGHMNALAPYFDIIGEQQVKRLWHECNHRQWFDWRRRNLDDRVAKFADPPRFDIASREQILDGYCVKPNMVFSEIVEQCFYNVGYTAEDAFSIIAAWAKKRGTAEAVKVAATLFGSVAGRSHLHFFDEAIDDDPKYRGLKASVHFGVKLRTLA